MRNFKCSLSALSCAASCISVFFSASVLAEEQTTIVLDEVSIVADYQDNSQVTGSVQQLDSYVLDEYQYQDVNQVVQSLSGVYAREEDGYGLRPNIGIRGATSERSQKITLMEDGVLIAPAPYAAPAAYYFPNVGRMSAVEVFKGPSSIQYGPHTVGGALNMVSRPIQADYGLVSVSYGSDNTVVTQGVYSDTMALGSGQFGYLVEGLRYQSDGFKTTDGANAAGFQRNDINAKLSWQSGEASEMPQTFLLKLGYADENSEETYLGLTDADFAADPNRRYAASQKDAFTTEHQQVHLFHDIKLTEALKLSSALYWNDFERQWNKFDGFRANRGYNAVKATDVFSDPEIFDYQLSLIKGEVDSEAQYDQIDITDFARQYGSEGLQTTLAYNSNYQLFGTDITSLRKFGLRYHHDWVERNHTAHYFDMTDGQLIDTGDSDVVIQNEDDAYALAAFYYEQLGFNRWQLSYGLRFESIDSERKDQLTGDSYSQSQSIFLPGVAVNYQVNDELNLLAGVHRGFSPNAAPSSDINAKPETSINYELGALYESGNFLTQAVGFFSDYQDLIGRCRVSDGSSCAGVGEFNAGSVNIYGLELESSYWWELGSLFLPVNFVYSWTQSEFQDSFESDFIQWGNVEVGDELPYLPEHKLRLDIGLEAEQWLVKLAMNYRSEMREVAGSEAFDSSNSVSALTTFDFSSHYYVTPEWQLNFKVENILDEQEIVSRRPFGARPNKPRYFTVGTKYEF